MFTKLEQRSWIKIEVARDRSTQECFHGLREEYGDAVLPYRRVAQERSGKAGCRSGQLLYRTTPHGEQHGPSPCFPVGCWSPIDCAWVSSGSLSMPQNCAQHSARHSGLPQTFRALDTPRNFRGATMGILCNRTGLVGRVPKGSWRLSWTNRRYGRNLGSLIRTKLENNQMNGIVPVLLVQRKHAQHNVLWRWCSMWRMTLMG